MPKADYRRPRHSDIRGATSISDAFFCAWMHNLCSDTAHKIAELCYYKLCWQRKLCASPKTGTDAQAVRVNNPKNCTSLLTVLTAFCISAEVCALMIIIVMMRSCKVFENPPQQTIGKILSSGVDLMYSVTHTNSLIKPRLWLFCLQLSSLPTLKPRHSFWMWLWGSQWYVSTVFVCQGKTI